MRTRNSIREFHEKVLFWAIGTSIRIGAELQFFRHLPDELLHRLAKRLGIGSVPAAVLV